MRRRQKHVLSQRTIAYVCALERGVREGRRDVGGGGGWHWGAGVCTVGPKAQCGKTVGWREYLDPCVQNCFPALGRGMAASHFHRTAEGASRKGPRQKSQKVSKLFST